LSEADDCKHVIIVIPVDVRNYILELALEYAAVKLPLHVLLPDVRLARLTTGDNKLCIG